MSIKEDDWTDEADPVLCELFRGGFEESIGAKIQEMQECADDEFCANLGEGYLQSV